MNKKKIPDSYRHKGLRKGLVNELIRKGIQDQRILDAIGKIPRHAFLDRAFEEKAYQDIPFPIGNEQTISQPYTVAFQTQLLEVQKGDKILEIGTGSGYQACVLVELGARVYSIERQEILFHRTNALLKKLGYGQVRTYLKDGYEGLPRHAPFDKILVTAGAKEIPPKLKVQLKIGGFLVIPFGHGSIQKMIRLTKLSDDKFRKEDFGDFRFVPLLKGINR